MEPSSRDRISVDLHGLKATLVERAQAVGLSPSHLVRLVLADTLGRPAPLNAEARHTPAQVDPAARTRLYGVEAEATRQVTRAKFHQPDQLWRLKAREDGRLRKVRSSGTDGPKLRASRVAAVDAWVQIGLALAGSGQAADRQLAKHIASFVRGVTDSNKAADAQTKPERPQETRQHPTPQTDQQQTRQQPTPSTDIHPAR